MSLKKALKVLGTVIKQKCEKVVNYSKSTESPWDTLSPEGKKELADWVEERLRFYPVIINYSADNFVTKPTLCNNFEDFVTKYSQNTVLSTMIQDQFEKLEGSIIAWGGKDSIVLAQFHSFVELLNEKLETKIRFKPLGH
jgi:hypothetical protein